LRLLQFSSEWGILDAGDHIASHAEFKPLALEVCNGLKLGVNHLLDSIGHILACGVLLKVLTEDHSVNRKIGSVSHHLK
jgi:hypothetical protein